MLELIRQRAEDAHSSDLFHEESINFERELSAAELTRLEQAVISLVPEAKCLLKLKLANEKQRRLNDIMAKLDNLTHIIEKLRYALSDVILIEYKQPSTELVYFRFQNRRDDG